MPYVCSHCHTRFDSEAAELVCPNCGAEAGIEPVKPGVPLAMRLFGAILAAAGLAAVVGSVVVAVA